MFRFAIAALAAVLLTCAASAGPFGLFGHSRGNSGCGSASSGTGDCNQSAQALFPSTAASLPGYLCWNPTAQRYEVCAVAPAAPVVQLYIKNADGSYSLYQQPATTQPPAVYYSSPLFQSGGCANGSCGTPARIFRR
jgi:hypothetical protein